MKRARINLIPADLRPKMSVSYDLLLITTALCALAFIGVSWSGWNQVVDQSRASVAALTKANDLVMKQIVVVKGSSADPAQKLAQGTNSLEEVVRNKAVWTEPFRELSGLVPPGVWLSKMVANYDKTGKKVITIQGSAPSEQSVSSFYGVLERSFYFRNILINFSNRQSETLPMLYNFEFTAPIKSETNVVSNAGR